MLVGCQLFRNVNSDENWANKSKPPQVIRSAYHLSNRLKIFRKFVPQMFPTGIWPPYRSGFPALVRSRISTISLVTNKSFYRLWMLELWICTLHLTYFAVFLSPCLFPFIACDQFPAIGLNCCSLNFDGKKYYSNFKILCPCFETLIFYCCSLVAQCTILYYCQFWLCLLLLSLIMPPFLLCHYGTGGRTITN